MEEWIVVEFPDERNVYVDGKPSGRTNIPIPVSRGFHRITLGELPDYTPSFQVVDVGGAPEVAPLRVEFQRAGRL